MKSSRCFLLLLLCSLVCVHFAFAEDKAPATAADSATVPIDDGLKVFTAGHSFHGFFVAPIIKNIALSADLNGHEIVGESKIGGSRAIQHWDAGGGMNKAREALAAGKVDVLTLSCMHEPDEGIEKFAMLGFEQNKNFRVSLQEFWMPWDKNEWPFKGKPEDVDFDAATPEFLRELHAPYFKGMDVYVVDLNKKLGQQVVFVAPAGQAVVALREKIIAGEVPGIAKQSELFTDKLGHVHPPVMVLVSYVHFAVIYRRSPVGLAVPEILKKQKPEWADEKLNRVLQEIAWKAVTDHPLSGVKEKSK